VLLNSHLMKYKTVSLSDLFEIMCTHPLVIGNLTTTDNENENTRETLNVWIYILFPKPWIHISM